MNAEFRKEKSLNGFSLDVLKSALQKYIRRGNIEKALYVAGELDLFKQIAGGEKIRTNFFNRLLIIMFEDVCNFELIKIVYPKLKSIYALRGQEEELIERLLYEIIVLLCMSEKARICSHLRSFLSPRYNDGAAARAFSFELFQKYVEEKNILAADCAEKICNSGVFLEKAYKRRRKPVWGLFRILSKYIDTTIFEDSYLHIGHLKESFLCWMIPLLFVIDVIPSRSAPSLDGASANYGWKENQERKHIEFDDFVFDLHTRAAGANRSKVNFALEGAKVSDEAPWIVKEWKDFYLRAKYRDENKIETNLETEKYKFVVRAQLVCSRARTDVYFARDSAGVLKVVKGPFRDYLPIEILNKLSKWKRLNNIPLVEYQEEKMIPDRWPEGTALGLRNSLNRRAEHYFIVFDSLLLAENIAIKTHSSKLWPPTEVVDWSKINLHLTIENLTTQEMIDYVHSLVFRYIFGLGDLADRNFLCTGGRIISIDEDCAGGKVVNFYLELKKKRCELLHSWIDENYDLLSYKEWKGVKFPPQIFDKESLLKLFKCQEK